MQKVIACDGAKKSVKIGTEKCKQLQWPANKNCNGSRAKEWCARTCDTDNEEWNDNRRLNNFPRVGIKKDNLLKQKYDNIRMRCDKFVSDPAHCLKLCEDLIKVNEQFRRRAEQWREQKIRKNSFLRKNRFSKIHHWPLSDPRFTKRKTLEYRVCFDEEENMATGGYNSWRYATGAFNRRILTIRSS